MIFVINFLIVQVTKPGESDYEVPIQINKPTRGIRAKNPQYRVEISQNPADFHFKIIRISTQTVM